LAFQQVHLGKEGIDSISFEWSEIEIPLNPGDEEILELNIINHGIPTHIYISVSDDLRDVVEIDNPNPFVRFDLTIPIKLRLPPGIRSVKGKIFISAGYGRVREHFILSIGEKEIKEKRAVEIDKKLREPVKKRKTVSLPLIVSTILIFIIAFLFTVIQPLLPELYGAVIMAVTLTFGVTYSLMKVTGV